VPRAPAASGSRKQKPRKVQTGAVPSPATIKQNYAKKTLDNRKHIVLTTTNVKPYRTPHKTRRKNCMPGKQIYYHRGTLNEVILALVARAGNIGDQYLSIVSNDHSKYYGLVDDSFLSADQTHPEDHHMRLLLRINDTELKVFHDTFEILQGDLFDDAPTKIPTPE
jgi:hypothetical protein